MVLPTDWEKTSLRVYSFYIRLTATRIGIGSPPGPMFADFAMLSMMPPHSLRGKPKRKEEYRDSETTESGTGCIVRESMLTRMGTRNRERERKGFQC